MYFIIVDDCPVIKTAVVGGVLWNKANNRETFTSMHFLQVEHISHTLSTATKITLGQDICLQSPCHNYFTQASFSAHLVSFQTFTDYKRHSQRGGWSQLLEKSSLPNGCPIPPPKSSHYDVVFKRFYNLRGCQLSCLGIYPIGGTIHPNAFVSPCSTLKTK